MLATTNGPRLSPPADPRIFSTANSTPAIGALKAADSPAAAPHPARVRNRWGELFSHRPIRDPVAAPATITGPSAPTAPPVPIRTADATAFAATGRSGIRPPFRCSRYIRSGMFSPGESLAPQRTRSRLMAKPQVTITGMAIHAQGPAASVRRSVNSWMKSMVR